MTFDAVRATMMLAAVVAGGSALEAAPVLHPASFAEHQAQCAGKEGWSDPAPPVRIFGNVYDVGTCGIVVLLISGDAGAVVIDGATAQAAPSVLANIERLGFRPGDVKLLLSTHEHADHAGGLRELKRQTGAKMVAIAAERAALESGVMAKDDPQREGSAPSFAGVVIDRLVRDGEIMRLGSLRLAAHATPGHAPGSTSWSWRSCEGGECHDIVYADSLSAISADGYRFVDHPAYVRTLRASAAKIASLPCTLIITPHPAASALYERLAGRTPLAADDACVVYARTAMKNLDRTLADETATAR